MSHDLCPPMSARIKLLVAVAFCLAIIAMGIVGFMVIDGYTFVEAFFMTVITISSVGYGEIRPLSDEGRLFTIFLILTGIGSLAYAGHMVVESVLEREWKHDLKEKKIFRAGADSVISPYASAGKLVADDLLAATGKFSKVTEELKKTCAVSQWIEVHQGSSMVGSTIESICRAMGRDFRIAAQGK